LLIPAYHDDIRDDRPLSRVTDNVDYSTNGGKLLTPYGYLPESNTYGGADAGPLVEANGNVATSLGYWRLTGQAYGNALPLPESHSTESSSATLEQTTPAQGSTPAATHTWNLVPGTSALLIAKDTGLFEKSKITWSTGQIPVGATRDGWMATRNELWNFNRWTPLRRHFSDMQPSGAELLYLLDTGLGVAELETPSIENPPSVTKTYLVMAMSADGVPAANNPSNPESLALGVDRISMLAEGGNGRVAQTWIMVPNNGGSTAVRFRSPATAINTLTLSGGSDLAFTPAVLNSGDVTVQIAGSAEATEDFDIDLIKTGNRHAATSPVKVKAMKHRTVKVALHKVYSVDINETTVAPVYMPTESELETYLNQVYGPQVNVTFDVLPVMEEGTASAGIDFDLPPGLGHGDDMLDIDDALELAAATPRPQAGPADPNPNANIDVWVIGGDVSLAFSKTSSSKKYLAYGYQPPNTTKVIVDGNVVRNHQPPTGGVPAGKELAHLLHTIAHEIGHLMTNDVHPGEAGYKSVLQWEGDKDPYLRKRLMCPGELDDDSNPGTCLIKKEWDRIEAWLRNEEIKQRL
jgi:hypothetical protein